MLLPCLDLSTVLVGLVTGCLVWYFYNNYFSIRDIPPFPSPPLPLIGHLHLMKPGNHMVEWQKRLGKVFSLKCGYQLFVFLNGYDVIKEAYVKRADDFSDRPDYFFDLPHVLNEKDMGIILSNGRNWKETRTVSLNILKNLGMGKNVLAEKINEEVSKFLQFLDSLEGKPTDIRAFTQKSVSNVTCAILLGERFDYHDPTFTKILELVNYNIAGFANPSMLICNLYPWLYKIPGALKVVKQMVKNILEIRSLFIKHHKEKKGQEALEDETKIDNFVAAYLHEQRKREETGETTCMSDKNLERTMDDLFGAGSETTSTTINWGIVFALKNPEVQEKVFSEMAENIGTDRLPSMQDKPKLPYLNAVVSEIQRFSNILPMGVSHFVPRDTQFAGYRIPAKTIILANFSSVLMDKHIWGDDVDKFRPERFLDEEGNFVYREELISFSVGRRACPGEALARMSLFLYIGALFQRYRFVWPDPENPTEVTPTMGLTMTPSPFEVCVLRRDTSTLPN